MFYLAILFLEEKGFFYKGIDSTINRMRNSYTNNIFTDPSKKLQ